MIHPPSEGQKTSVIERLRKVESISFTDYDRFCDCLLGSWPNNLIEVEGGRAPSAISRAIVVGLLYHDLLKALDEIQGHDYEEGVREIRARFSELLELYRTRYEKSLSLDLSPFDYWPEVTAIVKSVIEVFQLQLDKGRVPVREKELSSKRLRMHGVIDELWETEEYVELVEYKTTQTPSRLANERHMDQIHFYALLVRDYYGKPVRAQLKGLLGASLTVSIEEDRLIAISQRVEGFFQRAGSIGETEAVIELCAVSPSSCPACAYKFSCPAILRCPNSSIGNGNEIAVVDRVVRDGEDLRVDVSAGTVPVGSWALDESSLPESLADCASKVVLGGLKCREGRLLPNSSTRAFELATLP